MKEWYMGVGRGCVAVVFRGGIGVIGEIFNLTAKSWI